jgi:sortase A
MHPQGLGRCLAALAAALGLVACGSARASTDVAPTTTAAVTTTTLGRSTTDAPTTTTVPPTTAATRPATSAAATTTTVLLPQPAPAPDPNTLEPALRLGTIFIPRIGVIHSMWEGVSDSSLNRGPGHWPGTARPGQVGNLVIGGHRVSHDHPFRHIDQLAPGDQITIATNDNRQYTYVVTGAQVVTPQDVWIINQTPARTLTLFACHPPGSTRERFVVFAKLADS